MYKGIREQYRSKVEKRIRMLQEMTSENRFKELLSSQPWALKHAKETDIASYLGISVKMLKVLKGE